MRNRDDFRIKTPLFRNKRLVIALIIAIFIAAVFWSQSRVPALNEKAQMGLRTNFSSIAFDILLPVTQAQSAPERVGRTTVNWLYTNWKGMSFGLLFAAIALTILGLVAHRSFSRPWLNTLGGMFVGAPLGVCVNCATPIAHGMYAAGAKLETALATLISSPTLNVIVISMSFTLLPWEIALGNIVAVLLLLASLPLLVRSSAVPERDANTTAKQVSSGSSIKIPPVLAAADAAETLAGAFAAVLRQYLNNLIFILKLAVPLMLLAGFLGAVVIELAPFDRLANVSPSVLSIAVTALIATFLPVPMAFNVIVVMAMLANGMDPGLAAVLLFSLSAYSIYPATIIAKYISPRLSISLAIAVVVLSIGLGLIASHYFEQKLESNKLAIEAGLLESRDAAYRDIAAVCTSLPEQLQSQCVANQLRTSRRSIPEADLCLTIPTSVSMQACQQRVALMRAQELSVDTSSPRPCDDLRSQSDQSQCRQSFFLQMALREHNIGYCDQLGSESRIQACRVGFLNSSLLFNPDSSVCKDLEEADRGVCEVNAEIYRIADTLNLDSCDSVPADAREHCRWLTASNMAGRNNDQRGCLALESRAQRLRCQEHVIAWQATRDGSFSACHELRSKGLEDVCLLKVADRRTARILTNYTLSYSENHNQSRYDYQLDRAAFAGATTAPTIQWQSFGKGDRIEISSTAVQLPDPRAASRQVFERIAATELGITKSWTFALTDIFEPFIIGKGIASGDINNDLWPDLVLASEHGALLYKNVGGRFELIDIDQGELHSKNLFIVALVDVDNDGNQDLFASTYDSGNYLLMNLGNGFQKTALIKLPGEPRLSISAGFGDIDRDGLLDIVLGNWSSGVEKLFSAEQSGNMLLTRDGESYKVTSIDDIKGETNSVLIADVNGDGLTDLLFGNDRIVPDVYYLGTADKQLAPINRESGMLPATSMFTMSLESADFNNDLLPDLFSTDMTFARRSDREYCDAISVDEERIRCESVVAAYDNFSSSSAASCANFANPRDAAQCYVVYSIKAAKTLKDSRFCDNLPDQKGPLHSLCLHLAAPIPPEQQINQSDYLPQVQRNMLLTNNGKGFTDDTRKMGVASSFWSWNAKAADLDNDGWQDIYIGNGFHFGDSFYEVQANVLFRNLSGNGFEEVAAQWGLDDTINTPSYTYIDFDLDGDIDIIATGVLAAPRVFINRQVGSNSISFWLHNEANRGTTVGATVTIRYGDKQQRKEIKLSGGFMSFDNPLLHFGLASIESIDSVSIAWPDGVTTEYLEPMPANRFYRIKRTVPAVP